MTSVSGPYFKNFFDTCLAAGADPIELKTFANENPSILSDMSGRIGTDTTLAMLRHAAETTNDHTIGLKAGENLRPTSFLDVGHAILYCRSLRHVFEINQKYQPVTQELGRSTLQEKDGEAWLIWKPRHKDPEYCRLVTDAVFASHIQFGRFLTWVHNRNINRIHLRHQRPKYISEYERLFDCPVHFGQDNNAMILDLDVIDLPLPQANAEMLANVCERLDSALADIVGAGQYPAQIIRLITANLDGVPPTIAEIASLTGVSERTMRRKLTQEKTNFRTLLATARKKQCEQLLSNGNVSLAEIAVRLGYSEQSAFNRAFKAWHGHTPSAHKLPF